MLSHVALSPSAGQQSCMLLLLLNYQQNVCLCVRPRARGTSCMCARVRSHARVCVCMCDGVCETVIRLFCGNVQLKR